VAAHPRAPQAEEDDSWPEELASFFDGLELLEPGFVSITRWRPHLTGVDGALPPEIEGYGAVARKP